jgi:hypothetical protein
MKEKDTKKRKQPSNSDVLPSYESPVIVPLGELARGSGICQTGSIPSNNPNECTPGLSPKFTPPLATCIGGQKAAGACSNGRAVGK